MAKRLFSRIILNCYQSKPVLPLFGTLHCNKLHTNKIPTKEIQIPVKWGTMSAKLWGEQTDRPILALHGWQDNAGTWDPLIPMLDINRSILALDWPGHGLSSWIPPGMHYYPWELLHAILNVKQHFKWDKLSLLCHSMGSIAGLRFASLFPDEVDFYIAIDSLVVDDFDLNLVIDKYPRLYQKLQIVDSRPEKEPPSYLPEEISKIWHLGTHKSVSLESTKYLMERGVRQSKQDPNKYYFSRDPRLKHILFNPEDKNFVEALVKRLKCPTLYIKGVDSPYATDEYSVEMREVIEKNNEHFECHFVAGTHHVHLNDPDKVAPLVKRFLQKHKFL